MKKEFNLHNLFCGKPDEIVHDETLFSSLPRMIIKNSFINFFVFVPRKKKHTKKTYQVILLI